KPRVTADLCGRRMGSRGSRSAHRVRGSTMANVVANRLERPAAPDRIEAELAALWREAARGRTVSRAVMSNLVVFCNCPPYDPVNLAEAPADLPIARVFARHPP